MFERVDHADGELALPAHADLYWRLGASLYVPATNGSLHEVLDGSRFPGARSVIVCTEDSVSRAMVPRALELLSAALTDLRPASVLRFVRPRDASVLRWLVEHPHAGAIDGVVLPKVTAESLREWVDVLADAPGLAIMPIIETEVAFHRDGLRHLVELLGPMQHRVVAIRIGGNDILRTLSLRRPRGLTAYDTPLREAILNVVTIFKPAGYQVTAPVYEHIDDPATLGREVALDVVHGLLSKAAIHPSQIPVIEAAFAPSPLDFDEARRITCPESPAVFRLNGSMCEPATHLRWAQTVLARADVYGVRKGPMD